MGLTAVAFWIQQEYVDSVSEDKESLNEERAFVSKLYQVR